MRLALAVVPYILLISGTIACTKVPLEDDFGRLDFAAAHWFENEKVGYFFFSLAEKEARLVNPGWYWRYSTRDGAGRVTDHGTKDLDLSTGVHQHAWTKCGADRLCGSISFKSDDPLESLTLEFRYDAALPQGLSKVVTASNHLAGTTADAFSALAYGVFDEGNEHLQVRVHGNFGDPSDEQLDQYGMTRRFKVQDLGLTNITTEQVTTMQGDAATPLLYPASLCKNLPGVGESEFSGRTGWFEQSLDRGANDNAACFQVEALDKDGHALNVGKQPAVGRRNPEITNPNSPTVQTPLRPVTQLPLIVRICDDEPNAAKMISGQFYDYQQYVLGMQGRAVDLCFRIGKETEFGRDLSTLLSARLAAAKAAATDSDLIFVVLLHHNFSSEFKVIQATLSRLLYQLVNADQNAVSPRLVGAFVYDSNVEFQPNSIQSKVVIWCPQTLPKELVVNANPLATQNCMITPATKLDLRIINFIVPLGPLPSQEQYLKYVRDYGDSGLAKNPTLEFLSVPNGANTRSSLDSQITFLDSERYAIAAGEYARICPDRADLDLLRFVVKLDSESDDIPALSFDAINSKWLSDTATGDYRLGINWQAPFFGQVTYKSAVINGQLPRVKGSESVLPFNRSFNQNLPLGDSIWRTGSWDFGKYTQKCARFCDNPFFDASGAYQMQKNWRGATTECPAPKYPSYVVGGAG